MANEYLNIVVANSWTNDHIKRQIKILFRSLPWRQSVAPNHREKLAGLLGSASARMSVFLLRCVGVARAYWWVAGGVNGAVRSVACNRRKALIGADARRTTAAMCVNVGRTLECALATDTSAFLSAWIMQNAHHAESCKHELSMNWGIARVYVLQVHRWRYSNVFLISWLAVCLCSYVSTLVSYALGSLAKAMWLEAKQPHCTKET
jgi:hypothetical protein